MHYILTGKLVTKLSQTVKIENTTVVSDALIEHHVVKLYMG